MGSYFSAFGEIDELQQRVSKLEQFLDRKNMECYATKHQYVENFVSINGSKPYELNITESLISKHDHGLCLKQITFKPLKDMIIHIRHRSNSSLKIMGQLHGKRYEIILEKVAESPAIYKSSWNRGFLKVSCKGDTSIDALQIDTIRLFDRIAQN